MSYGITDVDSVKKVYEKRKSGGRWKPKIGDNRVRIMPPWKKDEKFFWYSVDVHWTQGERSLPVACTQSEGKPCFYCELCEELLESNKELANKIKKSPLIYVNLVDLDDEAAGVQMFNPCATIFDGLISLFSGDWGDITNVETGVPIIINKIMKGDWPKYTVTPARTPYPITGKGYLNDLHDLSNQVFKFNYDQQKALYDGEDLDIINLMGDSPEKAATVDTVLQTAPISEAVEDVEDGEVKDAPPQIGESLSGKAEPEKVKTDKVKPVKGRLKCFGSYEDDDKMCVRCTNDRDACILETKKRNTK